MFVAMIKIISVFVLCIEEGRGGRRIEKKDDCLESSCLGLGVANRSRVMVLVFVNWNLYKQNLCGFSSQRVRGFGLGS